MSKEQLHKRFSHEQVKAILDKYQEGELPAREAYQYLDVSRPRFYQLVTQYERQGENFSIEYVRHSPTHVVTPAIEANIKKELLFEKEKIIDNPDVPTNRYNYSYIQRLLQKKYQQKVSVPTIIERAKEIGCHQGKRPKKIHDREVITNYTGELIQHDSSHHLWAPDAQEKWYLITSLDDYSRALLYADFWDRETAWNHIQAAQSLILTHGLPFKYYVDQLRVFRYVKNRDSSWVKYTKFTDDADPQWKQVITECGVGVTYALSPQAKGKIERPYGWLQDHIVRTCVREGTTSIKEGRAILKQEVNDYNWRRVHSTTLEIPMRRFEAASQTGQSLWRPFHIEAPFTSAKDIFALRTVRIVDGYRQVRLNKVILKVPVVPPRQEVELRVVPDAQSGLTEVRFWFKGHLVGRQQVKNKELPVV